MAAQRRDPRRRPAGELVERFIDEELAKVRTEGPGRQWDEAKALFSEMALSDDFAEFLTLPAYERMP